jgi:membrane protein YdbS with pleckstrin-like domain
VYTLEKVLSVLAQALALLVLVLVQVLALAQVLAQALVLLAQVLVLLVLVLVLLVVVLYNCHKCNHHLNFQNHQEIWNLQRCRIHHSHLFLFHKQ